MSELKHSISRLTLESRRFHCLSFGNVPRHSGCIVDRQQVIFCARMTTNRQSEIDKRGDDYTIVARIIVHCSMMTIISFENSVPQLSESSKFLRIGLVISENQSNPFREKIPLSVVRTFILIQPNSRTCSTFSSETTIADHTCTL